MSFYARLMRNWELRLTLKDTNRQIFPFSWGLPWIGEESSPLKAHPYDVISNWAGRALKESERFYACPEIPRVERDQDQLNFETPTPEKYPENNRVVVRVFESGKSDRAVVVIPQWNADRQSHVGLCKLFQRLGITAFRLTLPYHEGRAPSEMKRADLMVGPNIGRTLHAARQAVLEVRLLAAWLYQEGYQRVGVMGTSLGSCVGYLAFTHAPEIKAGVFNHVSSHFADVVWAGLSTRYVKWGLEGNLSLEQLRACWAPLSPWHFIDRMKENYRPHLMITAKYDLTFPPELSEKVFERYSDLDLFVDRIDLPCGHYTTAHFPFSYLDGYHICQYLRTYL